MFSGTELSAVIFGQHAHLTLILVFLFWGCFKDKVYISNPRIDEVLKENILANIPANGFKGCDEYLRLERTTFSRSPVNCELLLSTNRHTDSWQNSYAPRSRRCTGRREA
jgi:hypothetical protein